MDYSGHIDEHAIEMKHYDKSEKRFDILTKRFWFFLKFTTCAITIVFLMIFGLRLSISISDYMDNIILDQTIKYNERSDNNNDRSNQHHKYKDLEGVDIGKAKVIHDIYIALASTMEVGHYEPGRMNSYHYKIDRTSWDDVITKADIDDISMKVKELLLKRGYDFSFTIFYDIDSTLRVNLDVQDYIKKCEEQTAESNK